MDVLLNVLLLSVRKKMVQIMCCFVRFSLQVTDMGVVLEVVDALEGIKVTADDIRASS